MDVQATLTRAANLAEIAHRELCELSYDPPAWEIITNAAKVSPFVDAGIQLKAAFVGLRAIAAAIERQAAALAALAEPAAPAESAAAAKVQP